MAGQASDRDNGKIIGTLTLYMTLRLAGGLAIVMAVASVAFAVLQPDFITTLCGALGTLLREVRRV